MIWYGRYLPYTLASNVAASRTLQLLWRHCHQKWVGLDGKKGGEKKRKNQSKKLNIWVKGASATDRLLQLKLTDIWQCCKQMRGSNPSCAGIFLVESYQWLKNWHSRGCPAWRYRVSAGTGWPGVTIPWLGEMKSLICNFYLSVLAYTLVWADPSLGYTGILLGR